MEKIDKRELNDTTGEWESSHKSKHDYNIYHKPKHHNGNYHRNNWAHYQAKQDQTLYTSFRKIEHTDNYKYHVTGTIDGSCMAAFRVKFFDDLEGIPKLTKLPEKLSALTSLGTNQKDVTATKVTGGTINLGYGVIHKLKKLGSAVVLRGVHSVQSEEMEGILCNF